MRTPNGDTEWFRTRQGFILPPSSFDVHSEDIMRKALEDVDCGVTFGGVNVNNLKYVDDTTLLCNSRQDLMNLLFQVKSTSEEKGLLLNAKKTKIMVLDKNDIGANFLLDGQKLKCSEAI